MAELPTHVIAVDELSALISGIFERAGCGRDEAERVAFHLIGANLTGHDSHGVIRAPRYVQYLRQGKMVPGQTPEVVIESATHAVLDGRYGMGQTIGPLAVDFGIAKAKAAGMCIVALRNCGHIGRIGDWAERAAAQGLVSIHFVNVAQSILVAPFGGAERRFGTNPFCVGVPAADGQDMMILDFATSMAAEGKVLVASNGGKPLPEGTLVTAEGELSTDPATLYGPLTPGGPRDASGGTGALRAFGDHKGSGIAFMCDVLGGILTGGGTSGPIDPAKGGKVSNGLLSIYLDPAHFGAAGFARQAAEFAGYVKSARPMEPGGEVLVPGEREARMRAERTAHGIPLQLDTWHSLVALARELGLNDLGAAAP